MQTFTSHHSSHIPGRQPPPINSPSNHATTSWAPPPPTLQSHQSSTIKTSSTLHKDDSLSEASASVSDLESTEDEGPNSPPANRPLSQGVNGNENAHHGPLQGTALPRSLQNSDQIKDQIRRRLQDLEELDSVRSRARAELMKKRHERDEEIRMKRIREDEKRRKKRDREDAVFAKSEQELDYEESELRQQLKRIKRGIPVDAPFPATRTVSFAATAAAAPPSLSLPPADSRSPHSSQNEPIRFDPFAKDASYKPPLHIQMNDGRSFPIEAHPPQQPRPGPFVNGPHAPPPPPPPLPPQLPSPHPTVTTFAPINRASSTFAAVNPPPRLDTGNRSVSTPINRSHYDASNGPQFQTREHYSPMNPPPFPHRTPIGPASFSSPMSGAGIAFTKRGPSTHPYMSSEAFAKRHGHCDREDSHGRGIWHHDASNTDRYIRCNHDNCGRMDFKTLHGFACHIVRRHDVAKGTLQGIQDALDRYGLVVNMEGVQQTASSAQQIPPHAPITPIAPPVPGQVAKKQQSPADDDESMDEPAYRMQGASPESCHEELVYSDNSETEDLSPEETPERANADDTSKNENTMKDSVKPYLDPLELPMYDTEASKDTTAEAATITNSTEPLVSSMPLKPPQSKPSLDLLTSDIPTDVTKPPQPSAVASPAQLEFTPLPGTPLASLDTKLAEEAKQANKKRSQQDGDYEESQTMTPQSPMTAVVPTPARKSGSPPISEDVRASRAAEILRTASTEPTIPSTYSTTTPPRSPQQIRAAEAVPESPYKQRISIEGFTKDAAKRMDRLDQEDSDYTDSQGTGQTQTQTETEMPIGSESVPISTATETIASTLSSNAPLPRPITTPSSKKRPTTRDGPNSPSTGSANKTNGFPSKTRRIGSRNNSISKAPIVPSSINSTNSSASYIPSTSTISKSTSAATNGTSSATQTVTLPSTTNTATNSDTDDADSIVVTAARPGPSVSTTRPLGFQTMVSTRDELITPATAAGDAGKTTRRSAAAASKGWSTLANRRASAMTKGNSTRGEGHYGPLRLEDIPSSPQREKVKRVLRVFSSGGSQGSERGGGGVDVKRAVEALAECRGREEEAINVLLDAAGSGRGEREKVARRRGAK